MPPNYSAFRLDIHDTELWRRGVHIDSTPVHDDACTVRLIHLLDIRLAAAAWVNPRKASRARQDGGRRRCRRPSSLRLPAPTRPSRLQRGCGLVVGTGQWLRSRYVFRVGEVGNDYLVILGRFDRRQVDAGRLVRITGWRGGRRRFARAAATVRAGLRSLADRGILRSNWAGRS